MGNLRPIHSTTGSPQARHLLGATLAASFYAGMVRPGIPETRVVDIKTISQPAPDRSASGKNHDLYPFAPVFLGTKGPTPDDLLSFMPAGAPPDIKVYRNLPPTLAERDLIDKMATGWMPIRVVNVENDPLPDFQTAIFVRAPLETTYKVVTDIGNWEYFMAFFVKSVKEITSEGEVIQDFLMNFETPILPDSVQQVHGRIKLEFEDNPPARQVRWHAYPEGFKDVKGFTPLRKNNGSWTLWPVDGGTIVCYQIHTIPDRSNFTLKTGAPIIKRATVKRIPATAQSVNNRAVEADWTKEFGTNPGNINYHS